MKLVGQTRDKTHFRRERSGPRNAPNSTFAATIVRPSGGLELLPSPETGCIAIKVINHYGDEELKVYEVT